MIIDDVVIIGSGPCGVAVADTLRSHGISSTIFEAGSLPAATICNNLAEYRQILKSSLVVDEKAWRYETNSKDYDWIRVRACGGRTLRWNGWLAHPRYQNFISSNDKKWNWPFDAAKLEELWARAYTWLNGYPSKLSSRYAELEKQIGCTVLPKKAAIAKNFIRPFCALDKLIETTGSAQVHLRENSIVTRILCNSRGVEGIEYIDALTGEQHSIKSNRIILSASTIETTRLLLSSGLENYSESHTNIGKGYTDHIAASYLAILSDKFIGEAIGGPLERSATIPSPLNSKRSSEQRGGFTIELHGPNPASLYEPEVLLEANLDATEDADVSCISVNAIGELCASPKRYVTVSDQLDSLGRKIPKIIIEWDNEVKALAVSMETEAARIATALAGPSGRAIKVRKTLTLGGTGTSHEASTCQIGKDRTNSVVDLNGQVHGINGLFIADASIMPSALDCHPTLTIVGLALNTADGVIRSLRSKQYL